jgi:hypothetical protein
MSENQSNNNRNNNDSTTQGGMQGVDKAPGEEQPSTPDNSMIEAQKGKKVDGDPSKAEDQPAKQ